MNANHSVRRLLLAALGLALATSLCAQQKPTTPAASPATTPATTPDQTSAPVSTINVDARLVNLPVVVRDKKGALIQNLTKDDFTLQVDGKPQAIRYFGKDPNLPLVLGLLVDTSLSQRSVIDDERSASSVFLDQMLTTPKDQAFVIQFASETELLQDLTSSRPKLQAALKEIDTPPPYSDNSSNTTNTSSDPNDTNNSGSNRRAHRGTVLYDALFLASDEIMSKQKGRKALIILSDGGEKGSGKTPAPSKPPSAPTPSSTPSTSKATSLRTPPITTSARAAAAVWAIPVVVIPVEGTPAAATLEEVTPAAAVAEATTPPSKGVPTAKRTFSAWPTRPADGSSRSRKIRM